MCRLAPVTVPVYVAVCCPNSTPYRSPETRTDSNNKHIFVIRFLRKNFAQGKDECKGEVESRREATAKGKDGRTGDDGGWLREGVPGATQVLSS